MIVVSKTNVLPLDYTSFTPCRLRAFHRCGGLVGRPLNQTIARSAAHGGALGNPGNPFGGFSGFRRARGPRSLKGVAGAGAGHLRKDFFLRHPL